MKRITFSFLVAAALVSAVSVAEARRHSYGLICGATQMAHFNIADPRYRRALAWADMPHTSASPGAVVVQTRGGRDSAGHQGGHVSRIVEVINQCTAIVSDEKGTYKRDICKNLVAYVSPSGGGGFSSFAAAEPRSRRGRNVQYSSMSAPVDRHGVH